MKTYEEMTASVFRRRDEYLVRQKRRRKLAAVIGSGFCFAALLTFCLWPGRQVPSVSSSDSSAPVSAPIAHVMQSRLYLAANGQQTLLKEGMVLPEAYTLTVQDIRELPAEEADTLYEEALSEAESEIISHSNGSTLHDSVIRRENAIIRCVRQGEIELEIDDPTKVAAISGKSYSGYGRVEFYYASDAIDKEDCGSYSGSEMTLTGDYYQLLLQEEEAGTGRLEINWRPSAELYNTIDENPDLPLSVFRDVFTLYVEYTDGTFEEHLIEVAFDDVGGADISYRADTSVMGESG